MQGVARKGGADRTSRGMINARWDDDSRGPIRLMHLARVRRPERPFLLGEGG
jgi:hypothetical protein